MKTTPRVAVVISFYNARSEDALDMLLWQLRQVPAGLPFDTVVMVNRAEDQDLAVAAKFADVKVLYRPNRGFNIGAWDEAWRRLPDYDVYVFLQDECLVAKRGWLRELVARSLRGRGRLLGESMVDPAQTWEDSQSSYESFYASQGHPPERWAPDQGDLHTPAATRRFLELY